MNDKVTKQAGTPTKASKTDVLDLASLDTAAASDAGARIEIVHPISKEGLGIFVTLLGKHSETFREIVREKANKRVKEESLAARRGKPLEPRTAEQIEAEALQLLVACSVGWDSETYAKNEAGEIVKDADGNRQVVEKHDYIVLGGENLAFNHANAMKVYSKLLWFREQVDNGIGDLENFIPA